MERTVINNKQQRTSLVISQVIIIGFLFLNVITFINKESVASKSLAGASFLLLMFLLIFSLKANFKAKGE